MATRFTALLLSLCIGLPMCWCSFGTVQRAETVGCCYTESQSPCSAQQLESLSETHDCPCCGHDKVVRDSVKSAAVESQSQPLTAHAVPSDDWRRSPTLTQVKDAARRERGPPLEPQPLYLRHRALLL